MDHALLCIWMVHPMPLVLGISFILHKINMYKYIKIYMPSSTIKHILTLLFCKIFYLLDLKVGTLYFYCSLTYFFKYFLFIWWLGKTTYTIFLYEELLTFLYRKLDWKKLWNRTILKSPKSSNSQCVYSWEIYFCVLYLLRHYFAGRESCCLLSAFDFLLCGLCVVDEVMELQTLL